MGMIFHMSKKSADKRASADILEDLILIGLFDLFDSNVRDINCCS